MVTYGSDRCDRALLHGARPANRHFFICRDRGLPGVGRCNLLTTPAALPVAPAGQAEEEVEEGEDAEERDEPEEDVERGKAFLHLVLMLVMEHSVTVDFLTHILI